MFKMRKNFSSKLDCLIKEYIPEKIEEFQDAELDEKKRTRKQNKE